MAVGEDEWRCRSYVHVIKSGGFSPLKALYLKFLTPPFSNCPIRYRRCYIVLMMSFETICLSISGSPLASWEVYLVPLSQPVTYLKSFNGGAHDLCCCSPLGGNQYILALLSWSSQVIHLCIPPVVWPYVLIFFWETCFTFFLTLYHEYSHAELTVSSVSLMSLLLLS